MPASSTSTPIQREVVIAEPFFSYLVCREQPSWPPPATRASWSRSSGAGQQFLVDGYDTFSANAGVGAHRCTAGAAPPKSLVQYVLGVAPGAPGFAAVRVAPSLGTLGFVEGSVPTPHGSVLVRVEGETVTIESPVPGVLLHADGSEEEFAAGSVTATL